MNSGRSALRPLAIFLLVGACLKIDGFAAQNAQARPPAEEERYGSKFFDQLRTIFGRFQNSDLDRVFQQSKPIQCSELVGRKGEWRPVAFFNEDRRLGDWCRESLEEVKNDLSVYTFKGGCSGEQGAVQVSTEFPTAASIEDYNLGRIDVSQVDVTVNDPVTAVLDAKTMAYKFELPYLFLTGRQGSTNIYSLIAPNRDAAYANDVTNLWECKAVSSNDVTYRFLICRTTTAPRGARARNQKWERAFGASAYFILSDGTEAQSSVNLTFGDGADRPASPPETEPSTDAPGRPQLVRQGKASASSGWQAPGAGSKMVDAGRSEFRLLFSPQTWTGNKIGAPALLSDQKMSGLQSAWPPGGVDCCVWRPEDPNLAEDRLLNPDGATVLYSLEVPARDGQSAPSIVIGIKTREGIRIGRLQCYFPRSESAADISVGRWISIVGGHITLEIRR
jgi:hypothetical protein